MELNIFISYRRDDTWGLARHISELLAKHFNSSQIFMDVDTIAPGEDFVDAIENAVGKCHVLLAVMGKGWLLIDNEGKRRIDNQNDFVRSEIKAALERGIPIIPLLIDNMKMPDSSILPDDLKAFSRKNAIEISHTRFKSDFDTLINTLQNIFLQVIEREKQAEQKRLADERALQKQEEEKRIKIEEEIEEVDCWNDAVEKDTTTAFQTYLNKYPHGIYSQRANGKLMEIKLKEEREKAEEQERLRQVEEQAKIREAEEDDLWTTTINKNTVSAYNTYLKKYPNGKYSKRANGKLIQIKAKAEEADFWNVTASKNTLLAYKAYLEKFPNGKYASMAKNKLQEIKEKEKTKKKAQEEKQRQRAEEERQGKIARKMNFGKILVTILVAIASIVISVFAGC